MLTVLVLSHPFPCRDPSAGHREGRWVSRVSRVGVGSKEGEQRRVVRSDPARLARLARGIAAPAAAAGQGAGKAPSRLAQAWPPAWPPTGLRTRPEWHLRVCLR